MQSVDIVPTSIEDAPRRLLQEHAQSANGVRVQAEDEALAEVIVVDNNLKPYSE